MNRKERRLKKIKNKALIKIWLCFMWNFILYKIFRNVKRLFRLDFLEMQYEIILSQPIKNCNFQEGGIVPNNFSEDIVKLLINNDDVLNKKQQKELKNHIDDIVNTSDSIILKDGTILTPIEK